MLMLETKLDDRFVSTGIGSDAVCIALQQKASQSAHAFLALQNIFDRGPALLQYQEITLIGQAHVKIEFIERCFDRDRAFGIAMLGYALACLRCPENRPFDDIASR